MKKCKECGREETGYGSLLDEDGYCFTCGVKHSKEKIKRLQERLNECEEALVEAYWDCYNEGFEPDLAKVYLKKWGVK